MKFSCIIRIVVIKKGGIDLKTKISWQEGPTYKASLSNGEHLISGDKNRAGAMNPPEMILASLAVCAGLFLKPELKKLKTDWEELDITAEAIKAEAPDLFAEITLNYEIKTGLELEELQQAILRSHDNCLVSNSLDPEIPIKYNIEYK